MWPSAYLHRVGTPEVSNISRLNTRPHDGTRLAGGAKDLPVIGSPATVEGAWPATASREVRLTVRVLRPTGFVAAERTERWWER